MPVTSSAIQAGVGLLQTGIGLFSRGKNQAALNKLANPQYQESKAISDYYNEAQNRYNVNPYESNYYTQAQKNAQQGFASGVGALQDRRSGAAGVGALYGQEQNSLDKAAATAEGMRTQAFGALGRAAQMKAGEDRYAFDINQEAPFERKYSEIMGRMTGNTQLANAGIQNVFGGIVGQPSVYGNQGGIGGLFRRGGGTSLQSPSLDDLNGVGVQDVGAGGAPSPAQSYGYLLNPNTSLMLAGG